MVVVGIIALVGLGVFFLVFASSSMVELRWGRHRDARPYTLLQQRIGCVVWGLVLIGCGAALAGGTFRFGGISQSRWKYLGIFLFSTGVGGNLLVALVGPRASGQVVKSRRDRLGLIVLWGFALLVIFVACVHLWLFVRG